MNTYLKELADMAYVGSNESYYGTSEQIRAFNDFMDTFDLYLTGKATGEEITAFDSFCSKATSDEIIDEAMRLAKIAAER